MVSIFRKIIAYNLLLITSFIVSCKKFLDVGNPPDRVSAEYVYQYNSSATAVLTGIYYDMQKDGEIAQGRASITAYVGLSSDEINYFQSGLSIKNYRNEEYFDFWTKLYSYIYRTNDALNGVSASTTLAPGVVKQLKGEALFLRAFFYFYLVNLYGDVPLLLTSDYKVNAVASRVSSEKVYEQMVSDLLLAQNNLSEAYVDADVVTAIDERVRPNKWTATALLARVYLYMGKWAEAEAEASKIINNHSLYDVVALSEVFTKNNKEAIWQLKPISANGTFFNTLEAQRYILTAPPNFFRPISAGNHLVQAFEEGDQRKNKWLGVISSGGNNYYYFFKYKLTKPEPEEPINEYLVVLRLGEQYLIRAEARAQQNKINEAQADLNVVRFRAGLPPVSISNQQALLEDILSERQVELFMEWGHRWFDLKRTGKINDVMSVVTPEKGGSWSPYKQWYPIPLNDLRYNKNLTQNEGYPTF